MRKARRQNPRRESFVSENEKPNPNKLGFSFSTDDIYSLTAEQECEVITKAKRGRHALHESGHAVVACCLGLKASAEIKLAKVDGYRVAGQTWFSPNDDKEHLIVLHAGIEASKSFGITEIQPSKDQADIEELGPEYVLEAQKEAETFVSNNRDVIIRMAVFLFEHGEIDEETTDAIYTGRMRVEIPKEFLQLIEIVPKIKWRAV